MRTALCFSGELRSIDICVKLIKEKIIPKIGQYDSFYFGWVDDPQLNKLSALKEINLVKSLLTQRVTIDEKNYASRKRPEVNIQAMLRQIYCLKQANDLKIQYEKDNNFIYDAVIRIRPDVMIDKNAVFPNLKDLDLNKLHIVKHDKWFGHNDRLYFTNSKNMDILASRINELDSYFEEGNLIHYEMFFAGTAKKHNIETQLHDFVFALLRVDGSISFCSDKDQYWSKMWQYPNIYYCPKTNQHLKVLEDFAQ